MLFKKRWERRNKNKKENHTKIQEWSSVKKSTTCDLEMCNIQYREDGLYNALIQNIFHDVVLDDCGSDLNAIASAPFENVM